MADEDLLKQVKASREQKTRAVAGNLSRFEWDRDRAARIAMQPYYQAPDMKPKDETRPQNLNSGGDNLRPEAYRTGRDVPDGSWLSAPQESGERKPSFDPMQAKGRHPVARPGPKIPNNPAEVGPGRRRG
jgi:hypothetical protein